MIERIEHVRGQAERRQRRISAGCSDGFTEVGRQAVVGGRGRCRRLVEPREQASRAAQHRIEGFDGKRDFVIEYGRIGTVAASARLADAGTK